MQFNRIRNDTCRDGNAAGDLKRELTISSKVGWGSLYHTLPNRCHLSAVPQPTTMHLYLRALRRWMHMLRCWRHHMRSKMVLAASDQWNHGFLRMWCNEVELQLCVTTCGAGQLLVVGFPRWNFQAIVEHSICNPLSWSLQPNARFAHRETAKHQGEPGGPMELWLSNRMPNDKLWFSWKPSIVLTNQAWPYLG